MTIAHRSLPHHNYGMSQGRLVAATTLACRNSTTYTQFILPADSRRNSGTSFQRHKFGAAAGAAWPMLADYKAAEAGYISVILAPEGTLRI